MASTPSLPRVWRTVRWPAFFSIAVVILRLVGELQGWDPLFFATAAGGGMGLVGASWLIPVFGFVFGWIVTGTGHAPDRPGLAIILHALGVVVLIAGVILISKNVDYPVSIGAMAGVAVVALLFAWRGWSELIRYTITYGLLVRLAVLVVTAIAFPAEWGTHFEKLGEEAADLPANQRLIMLMSAQMLFWIPGTVLAGGVFGGVAAMIRGRRVDDARDD